MLFEAISGVKQGDSLNHCWLIIAMIYQTDNLKLFYSQTLASNKCEYFLCMLFVVCKDVLPRGLRIDWPV